MTLRSKSTSKESMLKKYLQLKVTMMDKNTRELKQMMMLVNKERYPKLSELSKDGRKITQQDLDGTEVGSSYFFAFVLSKEALKERSTETYIQSILSDSYILVSRENCGTHQL